MIHRRLSPICLVVWSGCLAAVGAVGCDSEASKQAEAARELEQAITTIDRAQLGFVPDAEGETAVDVQAYRQSKLDEAIDPLEVAIERGSPEQAAAAASLRSDIAASRAMRRTQQALAASRRLFSDAQTLVSRVIEADAAEARLAVLERDLGPAEQTYRKASSERADARQALSVQRRELTSQLESLRERAQAFRDEAQTASEAASDLEDRAFLAEGEAQYELQDQAAEAQREAAAARAQAEQLEVQADRLEVTLGLIEQRIAALGEAADALTQRAKASREQQTELAAQRAEALQVRDDAVKALVDEVDRLTGAFDQEVNQPLTQAADTLRGVMDILETVQNKPGIDSAQETELRLSMLSRHADLAHVLSHHAGVCGDFTNTIAIAAAAADRLPPSAQPMVQALEELQARRAKLAQATAEVVSTGSELARELEDGSTLAEVYRDSDTVERVQDLLARLSDALEAYAARAASPS